MPFAWSSIPVTCSASQYAVILRTSFYLTQSIGRRGAVPIAQAVILSGSRYVGDMLGPSMSLWGKISQYPLAS